MKKSLLSFAVIAALASVASASDVRISGFVNVVGGMNNLDPNDITTSNSYRGYDNKYDFQNESLAAVQISGTIAENMGATIQLIAQNDPLKDNVRLEWGYISYDLSDEARLLAGRIRPSTFLYSDYLDVGYAYNWITPPDEVYAQTTISNIDGLSIAYNLELGDNVLTTTIYAGNTTDKASIGGNPSDFAYDDVVGGEVAISNDYAKLRVGYVQTNITSSFDMAGLVGGFGGDELNMNRSAASFVGVGLNIDYEDIQFAAEYVSRTVDETASANTRAYYGMFGYKIGDFTPNYTYASVSSSLNESDSSALAGATPVSAMVNTIRTRALDNRYSHTIGVRYELNPQAALKLEYNRAKVTHSAYTATGIKKGFITETDEDINTYRIALNVIF